MSETLFTSIILVMIGIVFGFTIGFFRGSNFDKTDELESALKEIAYHPHCTGLSTKMYDIGVTDGHRCAAKVARKALGGE